MAMGRLRQPGIPILDLRMLQPDHPTLALSPIPPDLRDEPPVARQSVFLPRRHERPTIDIIGPGRICSSAGRTSAARA